MIKKIAIKIMLLLLIFAGLNVIYNVVFYKNDLRENGNELIDIRDLQDKTDLYYFGESSNITYKEDDSVRTSIADLTNMFFPALKITTINKYATHAGIYKYWLTRINLHKNKPKAVIVTLNLRSFDAAWIHSKLETQLQQSILLTKPYPNLVNRFFLSLQAFDNKTEQQREKEMLADWENTQLRFPFAFTYSTVRQWDNGMSNGTYLKPDGSWDMDKIALACHYIKGYAFNLDERNPRIKDFDEIAGWCRNNEVSLYLNLLAENIEYADSLVGKELVFLMKQNRDYLVNRYSKGNCKVVDNLEAVAGKDYIDQNWTTEHYDYKGRMIIAKHLSESLKKQFIHAYKKAY